MPVSQREYFTVDLRGLRTALAAHATHTGLTESDVLRSALAAVLEAKPEQPGAKATAPAERMDSPTQTKLSVRLSQHAAQNIDRNARAAGLSRGAYLTHLINGAPPVMASTDRAAGIAALNASTVEVAVFSRDIHHLTQLLRQGDHAPAREYRVRLETLDGDVRRHLDLAAPVLAELSPASAGKGRHQSPTLHRRRSP